MQIPCAFPKHKGDWIVCVSVGFGVGLGGWRRGERGDKKI